MNSPSTPRRPRALLIRLLSASLLFGLSAPPTPGFARSAIPDATLQAAQPAAPAQVRFDALLAEAIAAEDHVGGLARAEAAAAVRLDVPTAHAVEALLKGATTARSPLVRVVLARHAEHALRDLNDRRHGPQGMKGPLGQQGFVTALAALGPFDNPSMEAFDTALPPELGEVGPYAGKGGEQDWRSIEAYHSMGAPALSSLIHPHDAVITYLASTITSPAQREAYLMLGASGQYKVWLNGELVAINRQSGTMAADNDAFAITLRAGENTLLVKVASDNESGLGFVARITDRKLQPMTDLTMRAAHTPTRTKPAPKTPPPRAAVGVLELSKAATSPAAPAAHAIWAATLWRQRDRANAATPWRDVAERAIVADDLPPQALARAAGLFEEHWRRRAILERAYKLAPQDAWIAAELAEVLGLSIDQTARLEQRRLLERTLAASADDVPVILELSDWYATRNLNTLALSTLMRHSNARTLAAPQLAMRLASLHERVGHHAEAERLRARLQKDAYLSSGWVWREIRRLQTSGKPAEALALLRGQRELAPWSSLWATREAELLRVLKRPDEAEATLKAAVAMRPGDADLRRELAELLLALNKKPEAIATLEAAQDLKPQDTDIRELLAHLRPKADRFHEPWMRDDLKAISDRTPAGPFHRTQLVSQTIVRVAPNGLSQRVSQVAYRVNTPQGLDSARYHRVYFQSGDEEAEVLGVRVIKPDGSVAEDHDSWTSQDSRKGSSTYNDTATLTIKANNVSVGDIVEFRVRRSEVANQNFRGDYFGDLEYVQDTEPIAYGRYAVLYPDAWTLHFRPPKVKHTLAEAMPEGKGELPKNTKVTAFEMIDIPYVKTDSSQPGFTDVYDYILVSNKKTYDDVGTWWWNLVKEQLIVDENIRAKVKELTAGLTTDEQKVQAIHNYVVQNTRYLHVGLGIHGWKPYRTTTCFRNRFGDCKDKASLLKVMFEEAGVPANLVLVRTRRLGGVDAFPASMHIFNHAITYVPGMDLFLDGTAEFNGTRELTSMDQGAQALVVMDGGKTKWVTLPVDKPEVNLLTQKLEVDLTGKAPVVRGELVARGAHAVHLRTSLEDPERRNESFEKILTSTYPGAKLVKAKYSDLQKLEQPVTIKFTFRGGQLLRQDGARRYLFPYGAPKDLLGAYAKGAQRTQDLDIRVPFANTTTLRYRIPANKAFANIPKPTTLSTKFGDASVQYARTGQTLAVEVKYSIATQRVAVADYPAFRKFMADIDAALNQTIEVKPER